MLPEKRLRIEDGQQPIDGHNEIMSVVQPLMTDMYQISMAYAYWKSGKQHSVATFDLFFRKNPFKGEFTIFAGLSDCLDFMEHFKFSSSDINYLQTVMPHCEQEFFQYLKQLKPDQITIEALQEGSVCFPRIPLMKVSGPIIFVQIVETVFLNLINYSSLVATNAARFRIASGKKIRLLEFGLRRAQGPNGGLTASKYSYLGGFDGTSNVLAGKLFGIPVKGTHAHAYVSSFNTMDELDGLSLQPNNDVTQQMIGGKQEDFVSLCSKWQKVLAAKLNILAGECNEGELAAFASFSLAFPSGFLALIDTYDVCKSGIVNFCAVALALNEFGYRALGVRIDSGDLAYLSTVVKKVFEEIGVSYDLPWFGELEIIASNDINEETILSLNEQGHKISCYGIGTHLVTCQRQPALGCVYKLVEVDNIPRIKLSQDVEKVTMPGKKRAYRLYGIDGFPILDLLQMPDEPAPEAGVRVLCRHPFSESRRAYVSPYKVEELYTLVWKDGKRVGEQRSLESIRQYAQESLHALRPDHKRSLNPTPYKVSVSDKLYQFIHKLWLENAPIGELC